MVEEIGSDEIDHLVERLEAGVGDALQVVGVGWDVGDVEILYVRDDIAERFPLDNLEDMGVDLLADRHLEVGNMRRHGLEGPTISARLYDQAMLVVCWVEALPVGILTDRDPAHFPAVADALEDALARLT